MTSEHVLQECPQFVDLQNETWRMHVKLGEKLYEKLESLKRMAKFIKVWYVCLSGVRLLHDIYFEFELAMTEEVDIPPDKSTPKIVFSDVEQVDTPILTPEIKMNSQWCRDYLNHSKSLGDLFYKFFKKTSTVMTSSITSLQISVYPHTPVDMTRSVDKNWKMPLHNFTSLKSKNLGLNLDKLPNDVRKFYERQDYLISVYESTATDSRFEILLEQTVEPGNIAARLSQISFAVNLGLMIAKAVAVGLSNSLSVISSLVDSVVDLLSGVIIWWTTHAIKTSNVYVYPVGRSRLEPIAIIILSVIMSLASLEVVISSVHKIIEFTHRFDNAAVFELPTVIIAISTVVVKFTLALSFYMIMKEKNLHLASVDALIQDHSNDTISNIVAIICGYLGSVQFADRVQNKNVFFIDPVGAILIALYIILSWCHTGYEQLKMVTGLTADPTFLSQVTWISLNHSPHILFIDTVRAFHFGSKFLVEVDIVLCGDTILSDSHDIGESLQQKLKRLPEVERAFVHVDFNCVHNPKTEHIF